MANYIVKRVLGAIPVFFGITLLVFILINMAPATIADLAGGEDASSAAAPAARAANLGLDNPLPGGPPRRGWRQISVWTNLSRSVTCCGWGSCSPAT